MPAPEGVKVQTANLAYSYLSNLARQHGLPPEFVQASLGILSQESGFDPTVSNVRARGTWGPNDPGENSWGLMQLNLNAHTNVTREQAMDPLFAMEYYIPKNWISAWNRSGGVQAFRANPVGFQQKYHAMAQGSINPTPEQAANALEVGYRLSQAGAQNPDANVRAAGIEGGVYGDLGGSHGMSIPKLSPVPTEKEALQEYIRNETLALIGPNVDPFDAQSRIEQLASAQAMLNQISGTASPDVLARIRHEAGMSDADNVAAMERLKADWVYKEKQSVLDRELEREKMGQSREISYANIAQADRQIAAQLGMHADDLKFKERQWADQYGLDLRRISADERRVDIEQGRLDLDRDRTSREDARFYAGLSQDDRQFNEQMGFTREQFERSLGLDRDRLSQDDRQFNQRLAFDERSMLSADRRANAAAAIDLFGSLISSGNASNQMAQTALNRMFDVYELAPGFNEFLPGYEPGGAYNVLMNRVGGTYDPGTFRVRPFPVDLKQLVEAGGSTDISKSWQQARQMMSELGIGPPTDSTTPAPGGAQTPSTAPIMPSVAQGASQQPTTPQAAPTAPTAQPPQAATPQAPTISPQAPNNVSSSPAPSAPGGPPQCGPGYSPVLENGAWVCKYTGNGLSNVVPVPQQRAA